MKMASIFLVLLIAAGFGIYSYLDNLLPTYVLAVFDENNILVPKSTGWALFKSMWIPCLLGALVAIIISLIIISFFHETTDRKSVV